MGGHKSAVEGIPLLCRRCGGPMDADADTAELTCPYCGEQDRLPEDQQQRVAELRRRLNQARVAAVQLEGIGQTLANFYEGRGALNYIVLPSAAMALLVLFNAYQSYRAVQAIPAELRTGEHLFGVFSGPLFVVGFLVATVVAVLAARRRYRRAVRPLLLARPPRVEGRSARCRVCGGDLPAPGTPIVTCSYCGTQNVLSEELHRERARLLAEEQAHHQRRAQGVYAGAADAGRQISRVTTVAMVVTWALVLLIGIAVKALAC
jgi:uncharacterized Zn-finger protein